MVRPPPVSVIVTVLDERAAIEALLDSLARQRCRPDEVVVVDGGSTDGTLEVLRERGRAGELPLVVLERPGANISAGRNAAIAAARGPNIACTDAGVRLEADWLCELTAPLAGGARFVLLATHTVALDTDQGTPVDEKQVAAVKVQALRILSLLEQASPGGALPALVVGDFNVGPRYADASYRLVADAPGVVEAGAVAAPAEAFVTWDPANPLVRFGGYPNEPAAKIDHVFVRNGTAARWTVVKAAVVFTAPVDGLSFAPSRGAEPVPAPLSDHYGFLADLELETAR